MTRLNQLLSHPTFSNFIMNWIPAQHSEQFDWLVVKITSWSLLTLLWCACLKCKLTCDKTTGYLWNNPLFEGRNASSIRCINSAFHKVHCEPKKMWQHIWHYNSGKTRSIFKFLHCCKQEETFYTLMKNVHLTWIMYYDTLWKPPNNDILHL